MHNTQNHKRFGPIRFPMSEITDWDSYGSQYEAELNSRRYNEAQKKLRQRNLGPAALTDENSYNEEYPAFGSPAWTEQQKELSQRDLQRFLGRRGLLETDLV